MPLLLTLASLAHAGGGPANVLVLYNAEDPDAAEVAAHYDAARELPPGHLCGLDGIDPTATAMDFADYLVLVRDPLDACLAALPQPDDIDYVILVRGLPYRVDLPDDGFSTSLQAMVQVLHAVDGDGEEIAGQGQVPYSTVWRASVPNPLWLGGWPQSGDYTVENPYSGSYVTATGIVRSDSLPRSFRRADAGSSSGYDFDGNLLIVTRLDGFDHDDAIDLIDRGVAADGTFPTAEILCMHAADEARGARDPECEFTTRYLEAAGWNAVWLDTYDGALAGHEVAAYFTGGASLQGAFDGQEYVPGAIADFITSYGAHPSNFSCSEDGATCPASEVQTSVARLVRAGATGAHGTVNEPLNNTFPNAGTLLFYTFGYNLGESFLFNQAYVYWQNIYLGDPLTTPFAERPAVTVAAKETVPQGEALVATATHPDGVALTRLYVDGVLVVEEDGDSASWTVESEVGATHEVLAVAVAENTPVLRPGWPQEEQQPRPDVQGWSTVTLTVDERLPPEDEDEDPDPEPGGCGCDATGSTAGWLVWLVPVLCRRRRS